MIAFAITLEDESWRDEGVDCCGGVGDACSVADERTSPEWRENPVDKTVPG
jgi:hypothetical protein